MNAKLMATEYDNAIALLSSPTLKKRKFETPVIVQMMKNTATKIPALESDKKVLMSGSKREVNIENTPTISVFPTKANNLEVQYEEPKESESDIASNDDKANRQKIAMSEKGRIILNFIIKIIVPIRTANNTVTPAKFSNQIPVIREM